MEVKTLKSIPMKQKRLHLVVPSSNAAEMQKLVWVPQSTNGHNVHSEILLLSELRVSGTGLTPDS